ncbi:MAG: amidohydrolase family protein [Clostridia bacterium]|nr:amidohydrolase family protein [Clostridia bacterium]
MIRIKSDKIVLTDSLFDGYVYIENGKILEVSKEEKAADEICDFTGKYVAPGFIEIHCHGGAGCEFAGSAEDIVNAANFHFEHGTTSICPTISAAPFGVMTKALDSFEKALESPALKGTLVGLHFEGPYLSKNQVGGQNPDAITPPVKEEYEPLLREKGKFVARWSYAPENDFDGSFAKALTDAGVVPSAGHTDATYTDMVRAFESGCRLVTHLYSCTSTITRKGGFRILGVLESAYLNDDMYVEIIADGKHLPPELIRLILKIKGRDRVCLITDSLAVAGIAKDGEEVETLGTRFFVEDGVCKLLDKSAFAGSIATADRLIRVLTKEVGTSVIDAVYMMTKVPAEVMGLKNKGLLKKGYDADIVVFDENINIEKVFAAK